MPITKRLEYNEYALVVPLFNLSIWLQVHHLPSGFRSEKVCNAIGNYVEQFIESDVKNFDGTSKNYVHIRVFINIRIKLKRDMRLKKTGGEWFTILFQYERLPTFCFHCCLIGHSDLKCEKLFDVPRNRSEFEYGPGLCGGKHRYV